MSKIQTTFAKGEALLKSEPMPYQEKLRWLASVVARSLLAVANDPNKRSQVVVILSSEDARKLAALQKVANLSNKPDTIKKLIRDSYARYFPVSK